MNLPDLARLDAADLAQMAAHAQALVDCEAALKRTGGVLAAALEGATGAEEWRHYPAGDIYDPRSHAQYFYHAHGASEHEAHEHGHFHAFLRARGMPPGARPLVLPELAIAGSPGAPAAAPSAPAGEDGEPWCHLVAIAMDETGRPFRLFTTNRWVTGETWYRAGDVTAMLDRFTLGAVGPAPVLNRWITSVIGVYRPAIAALVAARDEAVMGWRRRRRGHVFDDRRLEIASSLEISLPAQIRAVEEAHARSERRAS